MKNKKQETKLCIYCKHFDMEDAEPLTKYSTFGSFHYVKDAQILCKKGHWSIDTCAGNVNSYRIYIEEGLTCKDFEHFEN